MRKQVRLAATAAMLAGAWLFSPSSAPAQEATNTDPAVKALVAEVAGKGWLIFSARSESGSWDLFAMRPDGSQRRQLTNTPDVEEIAPRVSWDGTQMLYRALPKGATVNHDQWGFQGILMLAKPDATEAKALGGEGELPWASFSPDGKQLACLTKKGIEIVDLVTKQVVRKLPRKGIYQQLFWAPDGKWFCGVANQQGQSWTVVRLDATTGAMNPCRSFQNCTPDWYPDSDHIILSSRPAGQPGNNGGGYTQMWSVRGDGSDQKLLYGEDGAHIYGGVVSPDGAYFLFTKTPKDGSGASGSGGQIGIMRLADTPSIGGASPDLRKVHPQTKDGPVLMLEMGWEPFWTNANLEK